MVNAKKQPCTSCPYRKDAPLKLWDQEEFKKLLLSEIEENDESRELGLGKVYHCHKKDGKMCTGWLIMQRENNLPSIMLRMKLSRDQTTAAELESLECKTPMYASVKEMCMANYSNL